MKSDQNCLNFFCTRTDLIKIFGYHLPCLKAEHNLRDMKKARKQKKQAKNDIKKSSHACYCYFDEVGFCGFKIQLKIEI